ncbi:MAG: Bor family protein [Paludibacter sp.]
MKKNLLKIAFVMGICVVMTSCYTVTATIGKGSQTGVEVKKPNHFLIAGLVPVAVANVKEMAGDAKDYEITVTHSFVDGLLSAITGGLYTPTTTIVKK